jgi:hypothetical protein
MGGDDAFLDGDTFDLAAGRRDQLRLQRRRHHDRCSGAARRNTRDAGPGNAWARSTNRTLGGEESETMPVRIPQHLLTGARSRCLSTDCSASTGSDRRPSAGTAPRLRRTRRRGRAVRTRRFESSRFSRVSGKR